MQVTPGGVAFGAYRHASKRVHCTLDRIDRQCGQPAAVGVTIVNCAEVRARLAQKANDMHHMIALLQDVSKACMTKFLLSYPGRSSFCPLGAHTCCDHYLFKVYS